MNRVLAIALALAVLAGLSRPAAADYRDGLEAYNRLDYDQALAEWLPLANEGDAKSQYQVAVLYLRGEGVVQSMTTASQWFRKAADGGDGDAQFNLGHMYAQGSGVEKDFIEAYKWFSLAATTYGAQPSGDWANPDPSLAGRYRDQIAAQLSDKELAKAKKLAKQAIAKQN